jgi:5'-3' exonuclease
VFNWYKLSQKKTVDVPNILQDEEFMTKFSKLFREQTEKLAKKYHVPLSNVVFVKDCARDRIWRYEHFSVYKKTRDDKLRTFNGEIFKHVYTKLLPTMEVEMGVQSCEMDTAEADDIIAIFTHKLHSSCPSTAINIITNDNDYVQLASFDNVRLFNLKGVDLVSRANYPPEIQLHMKILLGDKSDNIPPVFQKFGEKKALHMVNNPDMLQEKLEKDQRAKSQYELNKRMIDFTCIPKELSDKIQQMLFVVDIKI